MKGFDPCLSAPGLLPSPIPWIQFLRKLGSLIKPNHRNTSHNCSVPLMPKALQTSISSWNSSGQGNSVLQSHFAVKQRLSRVLRIVSAHKNSTKKTTKPLVPAPEPLVPSQWTTFFPRMSKNIGFFSEIERDANF